MIRAIDDTSRRFDGPNTRIVLVDVPHPAPFYLRGYGSASYLSEPPEEPIDAPIAVISGTRRGGYGAGG
ncbi:MAG: hypothetical protein M5R36_02120 [Deltaproteobacteria bacterium]|nr:hypothetical protein [Deltaproteobacteria bacterium]